MPLSQLCADRANADSVAVLARRCCPSMPDALDEEESVRDAALRALDEHCGDDLYTYVLGAAPVGVWDADADGYRREFVAKAIVVDPYASGPPACADYVWAAKDEPDGSVLHATEATVVRYAPTVLTQCERRLGRGAS